MINSLYIIIIMFISILALIPLVSYINENKIIILNNRNRINNIDGLRGYLAIGVFVHHFMITYYWHRIGHWVSLSQNFINNLGQISVVLFFMITGYLFFSKIMRSKFNIKSFFIKRFFRLAPLYYFIIFLMLLVIFSQQKFVLYEDYGLLSKHIAKWLLFLQADINNYSNTVHINITKITAGVTWTLIYEWIFYISLPILFIGLKKSKILFYIICCLVLYYAIYPVNINLYYFTLNSLFLVLFFFGFIFVQMEHVKDKINFDNNIISFINIATLLFITLFFETSYGVTQFVLLGGVFSMIVLGNSLFGILKLNFSRILGEISYSIYLLHGIVLFIIYKLLLNVKLEIYHMPIVLFVVILFSLWTYKFIEKPMIQLGRKYR